MRQATHRLEAVSRAGSTRAWVSQTLTVDRPDYFGYFRAPAPPWAEGMNEHYWRRSPLSLVDKVRSPTLVLCGEKDARTPIGQTEMYFTALKLCGVDAALVRYADDNHSLEWHPSHWLDLIGRVDRWFKRYPHGSGSKGP